MRAISVALGISWYQAFDMLCKEARHMCNLPSSDEVWGAVLLQNGFIKWVVPKTTTAGRFCREHPVGTFVLAFGGHVATVRDGVLYDSWDSSNEIPIYYFRRA